MSQVNNKDTRIVNLVSLLLTFNKISHIVQMFLFLNMRKCKFKAINMLRFWTISHFVLMLLSITVKGICPLTYFFYKQHFYKHHAKAERFLFENY